MNEERKLRWKEVKKDVRKERREGGRKMRRDNKGRKERGREGEKKKTSSLRRTRDSRDSQFLLDTNLVDIELSKKQIRFLKIFSIVSA